MTITDGILLQLAPFAGNIITARYQAYRFDVLQKRIDHKKWAMWYVALTSMLLFFSPLMGWGAVWLVLAAWCMHFPVFSIALNLFRHKAWDYRNIGDPNGSRWDRWVNLWYKEVLMDCIIIWVFLQYLIFR